MQLKKGRHPLEIRHFAAATGINPRMETEWIAGSPKEEKWVDVNQLKDTLKYMLDTELACRHASADLDKLVGEEIIGREMRFIGGGRDGIIFVARGGPKSNVPGEFVAVKVSSHYDASDTQNATTEWTALSRAWEAGVAVPRPVALVGNTFVMGLIGHSDNPAPMLQGVELANPQQTFDTLLKEVARMRAAGIEHMDLNDRNILIKDGTPYIIDFSNARLHDSPVAMPEAVSHPWSADMRFFDYFKRRGMDVSELYRKSRPVTGPEADKQ